jgi:NADPH-dependent 2,4-dienoyl-CoA reductase/sulfur reductase-like enzyme
MEYVILGNGLAGIFAAGDVAESVDIARKTRWVNAIWPEAVTQGCIAGTNMTGRQVSYKGSLSRNVLRIPNLPSDEFFFLTHSGEPFITTL